MIVTWAVSCKAGCDPLPAWAACQSSSVGSRMGTGSLWCSQELGETEIASMVFNSSQNFYNTPEKNKQMRSTYEEKREESRMKENRSLTLRDFLFLIQYTFLVVARSIIKTSATGWQLIFLVGFPPEEHLPLSFAEGKYRLW